MSLTTCAEVVEVAEVLATELHLELQPLALLPPLQLQGQPLLTRPRPSKILCNIAVTGQCYVRHGSFLHVYRSGKFGFKQLHGS